MASGNQVTIGLQSQQQHASDNTGDSTDEDRAVECVYPSKSGLRERGLGHT